MNDLNKIKQLDSEQLQAFDTEYVNPENWDHVVTQINNCFPDRKFTFMDIGGGNGVFADRILQEYPFSNAILLDNSPDLIEVNKPHPRKKIILDSVENLEEHLKSNDVDVVFLNWLLHHLVSNSHKKTINNIKDTLKTIHSNREVKYVAIFENMYNGIWIDSLPNKIIFHLTSMKSIKWFVKKMGANTAGVGVSFLSKKQWLGIFNNIFGNKNLSIVDFNLWDSSLKDRVFLHIKDRCVSFFWIKNS